MIETLGRMEAEERQIDQDAERIRENMKAAREAARRPVGSGLRPKPIERTQSD